VSSAACDPPRTKPEANSLSHTYSIGSDAHRVWWNVDARKLKGADKHTISPPFNLSLRGEVCDREFPFKMTIYAKAVSDGKGGGSFKKARGRGYVQLKCEGDCQDALAETVFRITVGQEPPRGPVRHNFAQSSVCGLPKEHQEFNFSKQVDEDTNLFVVCLETRRT